MSEADGLPRGDRENRPSEGFQDTLRELAVSGLGSSHHKPPQRDY